MAAINYRNPRAIFLWSVFSIFHSIFFFCHGTNTITQGQHIKDGQFIISEGKKFVLGFFRPIGSPYRYVGIWYYKLQIPSVVWVANREKPIYGYDGIITIGKNGNLMVLDGNGSAMWSTNSSIASENTTAVLMDSGNLILSSSKNIHDTDQALWQSFNNPTDIFLPDMKVYMNPQAGETHIFRSWKDATDPSPGVYSMGIDPRGSPQIVIWEGLNRHWRSGHWNGLVFIGVPTMRPIYLSGFRLFNEGDGRLYFTYSLSNRSDLIRFQIFWGGYERQQRWDDNMNQWSLMQMQPVNDCDLYNKCGAFGKCSVVNTPMCSCMEGFIPKYIDQWISGNWSGGCIRRRKMRCERNDKSLIGEEGGGGEDVFLKIEGVKLPDFVDLVGSEEIKECEERCLKNCSCTAYAFVCGINCMTWSGNLVDVQHFAEGGNTLYLRLANSELRGKNKLTELVIIAISVVGTFFLSVLIWTMWRYKAELKAISYSRRKNNQSTQLHGSVSGEFSTHFSGPDDLSVEGQQGNGPDLALFKFSSVAAATNNFSDENKLGQGGFGPVYKGKLTGGQEIAVKRLSRRSGQGVEEFKNEIRLLAKLQHRNLVRLLGCCIEGEEKMLLYEYMPNNSLDSFIFDPAKQAQLDWTERFKIIEGIARGLLYLHRDSRLRIIHRDLKAGNILLDEEMNPKISDFGMARIFGGNQNEGNTNRVVGTYGYMAPEYAMEGLFSVKSDVYSFGVLILEIVSGQKITSFRSTDSNLIGYAWDLWASDKAMDLVDHSIIDSCCHSEVLRCISIGMLCVQDSATHRPTMSSVVVMLETESVTMPMPRQPTFTSMRRDADLWNGGHDIGSSNNVTVTMIIGR